MSTFKQHIYAVACDQSGTDDEDLLPMPHSILNHLNCIERFHLTEIPNIRIRINKQIRYAIVDTGASVNVISHTQLQEIKQDYSLKPSNTNPIGCDGKSVSHLGKLDLSFTIPSTFKASFNEEFEVIENKNRVILLGYPFLKQHRIIVVPGFGIAWPKPDLDAGQSYPITVQEDVTLKPDCLYSLQAHLLIKTSETSTLQSSMPVFISDQNAQQFKINNRIFILPQMVINSPSGKINITVSTFGAKENIHLQKGTHIANAIIKTDIDYHLQSLLFKVPRLSSSSLQDQVYVLQSVTDIFEDCQFVLDNILGQLNEEHLSKNQTDQLVYYQQHHHILAISNDQDPGIVLEKLNPDIITEEFDPDPPFIDIPTEEPTEWNTILDNINCYHAPMKDRLVMLLEKYNKAIAKNEFDLGRYYKETDIELLDEDPVYIRYRPTHPQIFDASEEVLKQLENQGVISQGFSAYSSPVRWVIKSKPELSLEEAKARGVPAGTKDESDTKIRLRLCADYRMVNRKLKPIAFPLLSPKKILQALAKASFITAADLPSAFYQFPLTEKSSKIFAFSANNKHYLLNRLSMGSKVSQQILQAELTSLLDVPYIITYSDNILVFTEEDDPEIHLQHIETLLSRFQKAGLNISAQKSHFFVDTKITLFGHVVDVRDKTLTPALDKIEKLRNFPPPTTKKMVRGFMGSLNYFLEFIPGMANDIANVNALVRGKQDEVIWTDEATKSFENIKAALTSPARLTMANPTNPFYLFSDAGPTGAAGLIAQADEKTGQLKPISWFNKSFSESECRFSQVEREAASIVALLKTHQYMLLLSELHLFTDCRALSFIHQAKSLNQKLNRWSLYIDQFNINVCFMPSSYPLIKLVDAISRKDKANLKNIRFDSDLLDAITINPAAFAEYSIPPDKIEEILKTNYKEEHGKSLADLQLERRNINVITRSMARKPPALNRDLVEQISQTADDSDTNSDICNDALSTEDSDGKVDNHPNNDPGNNILNRFANIINPTQLKQLSILQKEDAHFGMKFLSAENLNNGYFIEQSILFNKRADDVRLCIPSSIAYDVIWNLHHSFNLLHAGILKMMEFIKRLLYIKNLKDRVTTVVQNCSICMESKPRTRFSPSTEFKKIHRGSKPGELLHLDYCHVHTQNGVPEQILTIVDTHTSYTICATITGHPNSLDFCRSIIQSYIQYFGPPAGILTDNAKILISEVTTEICRALKIDNRTILPYRSNANLSERFHRKLLTALRCMIAEYSLSPSAWSDILPIIILGLNNMPETHNSLSPAQKFLSQSEHKSVLCTTKITHDTTLLKSVQLAQTAAEFLQRDESSEQLQIGDLVYVQVPSATQKIHKLFMRYRGPYKIIGIQDTAVKLIPIQETSQNPVKPQWISVQFIKVSRSVSIPVRHSLKELKRVWQERMRVDSTSEQE